MGIGPMTPSLPRTCSTTEPRGLLHKFPTHHRSYWSGKRDSNPRPSAWKADALPTELFPHVSAMVEREGFEPSKAGADRFTVCSL